MLHFTLNILVALCLLDAQYLHSVLQLTHLLRRYLIHPLYVLVALLNALPGCILLLLDRYLFQLMLQVVAAFLFEHLFHSFSGFAL